MESRIFIFAIFLILCGQLQILNAAPTLSESVLSHSVVLTFKNISLEAWRTQGKNLIMQEIIANLTTDYCQANREECGVTTSTRFKSEDVETVMNYPKNKGSNLETLIYVEIPTTGGSTPDKIPGETLLTIITNEKSRLSSEIGHGLESVLSGQTLSGSEGKDVNNKMNKVMIPVAFLLLLVIALICWLLHRGKKKKQAREERRKYTAMQNSKNESNLREKGGAIVNTADDVPPTQFQPERRPSPDLDPPENQAEDEANNNIRRHKKRRFLPKKQPIRKAPADESDDVFDDDDDPHEREKPKKKGRRRKGRRSYDVNQDYEMQAAKELACSQPSSEGTNGDTHVNRGYEQDSEKGESDPARNSNADSAVELSSSVASSANPTRARSLPPIPKASQQEKV